MVAKNKTPEERKEIYEYLDSIVEIIERKEGRKLIRDSDTGSPYIYVGMTEEPKTENVTYMLWKTEPKGEKYQHVVVVFYHESQFDKLRSIPVENFTDDRFTVSIHFKDGALCKKAIQILEAYGCVFYDLHVLVADGSFIITGGNGTYLPTDYTGAEKTICIMSIERDTMYMKGVDIYDPYGG